MLFIFNELFYIELRLNNIPIPIATPMMNMPVYGPSIYWGGPFEIKFTNTVHIKP